MSGMRYTEDQRKSISEQAAGKRVESLEYVSETSHRGRDESYWVMTFDDETEISFRFMAEIVR